VVSRRKLCGFIGLLDCAGSALGASGRLGDESLASCGSVVPGPATQYWRSTPDKIQVKMPDETSSEFLFNTLSRF